MDDAAAEKRGTNNLKNEAAKTNRFAGFKVAAAAALVVSVTALVGDATNWLSRVILSGASAATSGVRARRRRESAF